VLRELAESLDVQDVYRRTLHEMTAWDLDEPQQLRLGYSIDEDLSTRARYEHEAAAIAWEGHWRPHVVFYSGVVQEPAVDPDESLSRLAALARELQVDLVVELRVGDAEALKWNVRFAYPGEGLPRFATASHNTLHRALIKTGVDAALARLRDHLQNTSLDVGLIDGRSRRSDPDPVAAFLHTAGRRRPAGRLIVLARRPAGDPPNEDVLRSAIGLGLTVAFSVRTAPKPRVVPAPTLRSWRVTVQREPLRPALSPSSRDPVTLGGAIDELGAGFDTARLAEPWP
jgi:hypothetical protein